MPVKKYTKLQTELIRLCHQIPALLHQARSEVGGFEYGNHKNATLSRQKDWCDLIGAHTHNLLLLVEKFDPSLSISAIGTYLLDIAEIISLGPFIGSKQQVSLEKKVTELFDNLFTFPKTGETTRSNRDHYLLFQKAKILIQQIQGKEENAFRGELGSILKQLQNLQGTQCIQDLLLVTVPRDLQLLKNPQKLKFYLIAFELIVQYGADPQQRSSGKYSADEIVERLFSDRLAYLSKQVERAEQILQPYRESIAAWKIFAESMQGIYQKASDPHFKAVVNAVYGDFHQDSFEKLVARKSSMYPEILQKARQDKETAEEEMKQLKERSRVVIRQYKATYPYHRNDGKTSSAKAGSPQSSTDSRLSSGRVRELRRRFESSPQSPRSRLVSTESSLANSKKYQVPDATLAKLIEIALGIKTVINSNTLLKTWYLAQQQLSAQPDDTAVGIYDVLASVEQKECIIPHLNAANHLALSSELFASERLLKDIKRGLRFLKNGVEVDIKDNDTESLQGFLSPGATPDSQRAANLLIQAGTQIYWTPIQEWLNDCCKLFGVPLITMTEIQHQDRIYIADQSGLELSIFLTIKSLFVKSNDAEHPGYLVYVDANGAQMVSLEQWFLHPEKQTGLMPLAHVYVQYQFPQNIQFGSYLPKITAIRIASSFKLEIKHANGVHYSKKSSLCSEETIYKLLKSIRSPANQVNQSTALLFCAQEKTPVKQPVGDQKYEFPLMPNSKDKYLGICGSMTIRMQEDLCKEVRVHDTRGFAGSYHLNIAGTTVAPDNVALVNKILSRKLPSKRLAPDMYQPSVSAGISFFSASKNMILSNLHLQHFAGYYKDWARQHFNGHIQFTEEKLSCCWAIEIPSQSKKPTVRLTVTYAARVSMEHQQSGYTDTVIFELDVDSSRYKLFRDNTYARVSSRIVRAPSFLQLRPQFQDNATITVEVIENYAPQVATSRAWS